MNNKFKTFPNSNFKVDTFFRKPEYRSRINAAASTGDKKILTNEIRKINNSRFALYDKGYIRIKDIFQARWDIFKFTYQDKLAARPGLIDSIESFVSCQNLSKGYIYYQCPNCDNFHLMGLSCHSRLCPTCGKKYKDQRTIKVSEKCLNIPHRQFVFTIPDDFRNYFLKDRKLLNVLFDSVKDTLNFTLDYHTPKCRKYEKRKLGFISFLHTFGRDLKWNPHIHVLLAEAYLTSDNKLVKYDFFSFEFVRKSFQNFLFNNMYNYMKMNNYPSKEKSDFYLLCQKLRSKHDKGFYVYGKKNKNCKTIKDVTSLTNYIARYASHPAISERRIINVDFPNNLVTWYYDPHEDDDIEDTSLKMGRQVITESIDSFMIKLIRHIPNKGFQQIRYYGFYSNKFKHKVTNNNLLTDAQLTKMLHNTYWIESLLNTFGYNPILCECGHEMFVNYLMSVFPTSKGPPYEKT